MTSLIWDRFHRLQPLLMEIVTQLILLTINSVVYIAPRIQQMKWAV
jgi:hypothetical protein